MNGAIRGAITIFFFSTIIAEGSGDLASQVRTDVLTQATGQPSAFAIASAAFKVTVGPLPRSPSASPSGVRPTTTNAEVIPLRPLWPQGFIVTESPAPKPPAVPAKKIDFEAEITSAARMIEER